MMYQVCAFPGTRYDVIPILRYYVRMLAVRALLPQRHLFLIVRNVIIDDQVTTLLFLFLFHVIFSCIVSLALAVPYSKLT